MNIILNHTLRSIKDNKRQVALIITTIAVVTVMIFVALSLSGLFYNLNVSAESRLAGDADIVVRGEPFSRAKIDDFIKNNFELVEYVDYYLQLPGLVRVEQDTRIILLEATSLAHLYDRHNDKLSTINVADVNFEYPAIWMGKDFADDLGVGIGDTIEIYFQGEKSYQKYCISRIMREEGLFADVNVNNIVIDYSSIANRGMVNCVFLKLKNNRDFLEIKSRLQAFMQNDSLEITTAVDHHRANQIVKNNTNLLNVALAFILTIMALILFTSYLVIARNRLSEMIIFKATGATSMQTTLIMISEVVLYGTVGALLGVLLGRICMGVATAILLPNFPNAISYEVWKYFVAILISISISVASALLPILRISKKTIREMSSGTIKDIRYIKPIVIVILSLCLTGCVAIMFLYNRLVVTMTFCIIVLFVFWIYFLMPYIIKWISRIFSKTRKESHLASISIKRNASATTLSILVGAVITFSFIVISVISLIITAIIPYNTRFNADYVITSSQPMQYDFLISELSAIDGVKDIVYYKTTDFELQFEKDKKLTYQVIGINDAQALLYATKGLTEQDIDNFHNTNHPVILNYDMSKRFDLQVGDKFDIERISSDLGATYTEKLDFIFEVIAIDYTTTEYDRLMYIKIEDMTIGGEQILYKDEKVFVSIYDFADYRDVYFSIRDKLTPYSHYFLLGQKEWSFATVKGLSGVTALLRLIQIMVSLVAFVGVVNLTIVTFADRRKEYYIYKTCGMSVGEYNKLSFYESIIIGASGGIVGIILSLFFNSLMPSFAELINKYLIYKLFPLVVPIIAVVGIMIYAVLYIAISISNNKRYLQTSYHNQRDNL